MFHAEHSAARARVFALQRRVRAREASNWRTIHLRVGDPLCAETCGSREQRSPGLRYAPGRGAGSCATGAASGILPVCVNVRERAARIETCETNPIEAIAKPHFQATGREMCHRGPRAADETKPTAVWATWLRDGDVHPMPPCDDEGTGRNPPKPPIALRRRPARTRTLCQTWPNHEGLGTSRGRTKRWGASIS